MRIPKRFKLMGQTIEVTWDTVHFAEKTDVCGFASYRTNEIQMNPNMPYKSDSQREQTFLHELMHFVVYHSQTAKAKDCDYLHQDEPFIDLTAHLLHQALTTMEYE